MTQATTYLIQFREAQTATERKQIADDYQAYFATLTESEQQQARLTTAPLRDDIQQTMDELDRLTAQAEQLLAVKADNNRE